MAALPPLGGSHPPRGETKLALKKERSGLRDEAGDIRSEAAAATRDANKQVETANRSVEQARHDADMRIDDIRDTYAARSEQEYAREQAAFEKERLKGYERLRDLKREQEGELYRAQRDGQRRLDQTKDHYVKTTYATQTDGERKLQEIRAHEGREMEAAAATKNDNVSMQQDQHMRQMETVRTAHDEAIDKLKQQSSTEYERVRGNALLANQKAQETYDLRHEELTTKATDQLQELESKTSHRIREIRKDTSQRLSAYADRQGDPFYRMMDLDADLTDHGDYYELTARIPQHEQNHVAVAVRGEQIVLSGYRRNEEKLEIEPGRMQGTNAFQSFLETFPISWPVDAKKLSREFEGDRLIVRVPKKGSAHEYRSPGPEKVAVARARLERPKFPDNLPHVTQDPYAEKPRPESTVKKSKGSGTLS